MSPFKLATSQEEEEEEVRISSSLFDQSTEELEVRGEGLCWICLPFLAKLREEQTVLNHKSGQQCQP